VIVDPSVRTVLVLEAERPPGRADPHWQKLRDDLHVVLSSALLDTGIEPEMIEDRGDGALVVFRRPAQDVLDQVMDSLVDQLSEVNAPAPALDRLCLCFAIHFGLVHQDQHGWSGVALDETFELASLPPVKAMLRAAERAQCVVVVSDEVYHQVVCQRYNGLNPSVYRQIVHDGRVGWAMVPGYPVPPDPESKSPPASAPTQQHLRNNYGNNFVIDTVHHIDARVSRSPAGDS